MATSRNTSRPYEYSHSNYDLFERFIQDHAKHNESLSSIGNLSDDQDAYFEKTVEVEQHSQAFLSRFFATQEYVDTVVAGQGEKGHKEAFPSCITFVDMKIGDKPICFVSISGGYSDKETNMQILEEFINDYNSTSSDVEYVLVGGRIENTNKLLANLQGCASEDVHKPCAEKYLIAGLAKVFEIYGDQAKILGSANYTFYPYQHDQIYGNKVGSIDPNVVHVNRQKLRLDDKYYVSQMPCCSLCQVNKKSALLALKCAQILGEQPAKLINSPVTRTYRTRTSLLSTLYRTSKISDDEDEDDLPPLEPIESDKSNQSEKSSVSAQDESKTTTLLHKSSHALFRRRTNNAKRSQASAVKSREPRNDSEISVKHVPSSNDLEKQPLEEIITSLCTAFNLHHMSQHFNHRGEIIHKPADIRAQIEAFVYESCSDYLSTLKPKEFKKCVNEIAKNAYSIREHEEGWFCCKTTVRTTYFDTKRAHKLLNSYGDDFETKLIKRFS